MKALTIQSTAGVLIVCFMTLTLSSCMPIQPPAATTTESPADGITSAPSAQIQPTFDIVNVDVVRVGDQLIFTQKVAGIAGSSIITPSGKLAGAAVESYVWPTSLNSSSVGFADDQGILALAVTSHPDFDDTPLVDENQDGKNDNDGGLWHTHWVVLTKDDACGKDGLKVKDIGEGETPALPATWPNLPILIDSPDFALALENDTVTVHVPEAKVRNATAFNYDGVTAGLKVNADLHAPLLCVSAVFDIASGDLSLPGEVK